MATLEQPGNPKRNSLGRSFGHSRQERPWGCYYETEIVPVPDTVTLIEAATSPVPPRIISRT